MASSSIPGPALASVCAVTRPLLVGIQLPEVEWEVPFAGADPHGPDRRGRSGSTRSGSATICSTTSRSARVARGRCGHRSPRWRHRRSECSSARSSRRWGSTNRRCSPSRQRRSTRCSGGRLIVGLGAGWNEREYRAFGFPFDHRVSRFEEAFTIIRRLLVDGEIDFAGSYYRAERCVLHPRPNAPGGPPLMVGSVRPRMMSITLPARRRVERVVERLRQLGSRVCRD